VLRDTSHNTTGFRHSLKRHFFSQSISAYRALLALAIMRYTNLRFTYLLTYKLITTLHWPWSRRHGSPAPGCGPAVDGRGRGRLGSRRSHSTESWRRHWCGRPTRQTLKTVLQRRTRCCVHTELVLRLCPAGWSSVHCPTANQSINQVLFQTTRPIRQTVKTGKIKNRKLYDYTQRDRRKKLYNTIVALSKSFILKCHFKNR